MTKFPEIEVGLTGEDGNAFFIIARTCKAMRRGGVSEQDVRAYRDKAMAGDYDNVLRVTMETVTTF